MQGLELEWFSSYLNDRYQITKIGDHYSTKAPVNFGVPQGSILGPLLFTVYLNDLTNHLKSTESKVYLYADDTAIFVRGKTVEGINRVLNSELNHVSKWLQKNFLTLNVKKTKTMLFATKRKLATSNESLKVYIKKDPIENVDSFKYLGIWLDPSLTWTTNIDKLVSKVNKRIGLLRRIRNVLPQHTLNLLFKSLIIPHFDYCNVVWGNACKTNLARLDKLQNAAGKVILGLPRRYPADILLEKLGWQKLHERRSIPISMSWSTKVLHAISPPICAIFSIVSMRPILM